MSLHRTKYIYYIHSYLFEVLEQVKDDLYKSLSLMCLKTFLEKFFKSIKLKLKILKCLHVIASIIME